MCLCVFVVVAFHIRYPFSHRLYSALQLKIYRGKYEVKERESKYKFCGVKRTVIVKDIVSHLFFLLFGQWWRAFPSIHNQAEIGTGNGAQIERGKQVVSAQIQGGIGTLATAVIVVVRSSPVSGIFVRRRLKSWRADAVRSTARHPHQSGALEQQKLGLIKREKQQQARMRKENQSNKAAQESLIT